VVPDAARLRGDIECIEQAIKKYEEEMKGESPTMLKVFFDNFALLIVDCDNPAVVNARTWK
jgi:hypothetical protein